MTDLFKTRAQLIEETLGNLGQLDPGEAPSTEDYATVDGKIDPFFAQLAADEIYYVQNVDQIELEIFLPLARLLANVCVPRFGYPVNDDARAADEAVLKRLSSLKPTYAPAAGEYF